MKSRSNNNLRGIDVSFWQGDIDFQEVKNSGIQVVYMKATEGTGIIDRKLLTNYRNAKSSGLKIGFYHFFRAIDESDAKQEAIFFINAVKDFNNDCKHVLDLETTQRFDKYTLSNLAITFINEVKRLTGQDTIIYTYTSFARYNVADELSAYPLWIAHYGVDAPGDNGIWDNWVGFQYTDSGSVSGISGNVDLDEFTQEIFVNANTTTTSTPANTAYSTNEAPVSQHIYVIEPGDTLYGIAKKFNYPGGYMALARDNNIKNPNLIHVGDKLYLKNS